MSATLRNSTLPHGALCGAAGLVLGALLVVGIARLSGYTPPEPPPSAALEVRDVRFVDRTDGGIEIYRAGQVSPIDTLAPGTNGFVRGVLRGLARERRARGVGSGPPFRLTRWADGRLSLDDPSTGRHVDLEVFGPTNSSAFAQILIRARGG